MTKILNHINTYADLTAYDNDMSKDFPNISYIQGSDEVKWAKDDSVHIVCKYNVTSTSNATKLLNSNTGITYQIIDGIKQDAVQTSYTFDTLGEHIVEYKLDGTSIGVEAFYSCSDLTSITIPNGVTSIGNSAFNWCTGLTSITIPNGVTSIGDNTFNYCTGLTSVTIPDSVTSIGDSAFDSCEGLTSITIPNGVTSIGMGAFNSCTGLTSITIPDSVTSIDYGAFDSCTGLTSITIGSGVTSIGDNTFNYCTGLTSVIIGNSVTSIGDSAFDSCEGLTSITIEATTPPSLGSNAFSNTSTNLIIYVPAESVDAYKAASNWNSLASRIKPIS